MISDDEQLSRRVRLTDFEENGGAIVPWHRRPLRTSFQRTLNCLHQATTQHTPHATRHALLTDMHRTRTQREGTHFFGDVFRCTVVGSNNVRVIRWIQLQSITQYRECSAKREIRSAVPVFSRCRIGIPFHPPRTEYPDTLFSFALTKQRVWLYTTSPHHKA